MGELSDGTSFGVGLERTPNNRIGAYRPGCSLVGDGELHLEGNHTTVGGPEHTRTASQSGRRDDRGTAEFGKDRGGDGFPVLGRQELQPGSGDKIRNFAVLINAQGKRGTSCSRQRGPDRRRLGLLEQRVDLVRDHDQDSEDRTDNHYPAQGDKLPCQSVHPQPTNQLSRNGYRASRGKRLARGENPCFVHRPSPYMTLPISSLAMEFGTGKYPSLMTASWPSLLKTKRTNSRMRGSRPLPGARLTYTYRNRESAYLPE